MNITPNDEQLKCINEIHNFIIEMKPFSKLLINGSAGTGKTTILISSIVDFINVQIMSDYDKYKFAVRENNWELITPITNFIIAAPTNKAKDVLINKYNSYMANLISAGVDASDGTGVGSASNVVEMHDIRRRLSDNYILNEIVQRKLTFLTVAQVLSISRVINEAGEEEFTKGNERKIAEKYNKPNFDNTIIIIDECSMIDDKTTKLLYIIRCPLIFIGDACQLPPVGEFISPVFDLKDDMNARCVVLSKVERCKNNITDIANKLRDKIYLTMGINIPGRAEAGEFNLLIHKIKDIIHYKKKETSWIEVYCADILKKLATLSTLKTISQSGSADQVDGAVQGPMANKVHHDSMALAWTNKCCSGLNKKIRNKIFEQHTTDPVDKPDQSDQDNDIDDFDIDDYFLINGDKLLVKVPYYKYDQRIYSSSIAYVIRQKKTTYKPLNFRDWITFIFGMLNAQSPKKPVIDMKQIDMKQIDIFSILDSGNTTKQIKPKNKSITDYFGSAENSDGAGVAGVAGLAGVSESDGPVIPDPLELQKDRINFYKYHNYNSILGEATYIFKDEFSLKYKTHIPEIDLTRICELPNPGERASRYRKWHQLMGEYLFGIPTDQICCKKCAFFIKKFHSIGGLLSSPYVEDMFNATNNLTLDMYITDLAIISSSGKQVYDTIPIMNMINKSNLESITVIRNVIRNSYEVKLPLTRQDENELKSINKQIGEDDEFDARGISGPNTGKRYITMSQMLGHYLNHVIIGNYLEVDYGYVLTVHKSQGSTYDDVYVEYNNLMLNKKSEERYKLLYTAITRCANKLHLFY